MKGRDLSGSSEICNDVWDQGVVSGDSEIPILRRTKRVLVFTPMCSVKLMDEIKTEDLMRSLGLEGVSGTAGRGDISQCNMGRYGHVLRIDCHA